MAAERLRGEESISLDLNTEPSINLRFGRGPGAEDVSKPTRIRLAGVAKEITKHILEQGNKDNSENCLFSTLQTPSTN